MKYVPLGSTGVEVSWVGFGAAGLGNEYGPRSESDAIAALHYALESGVNYIDTSPYYGRGLSEERLGKALEGRRDDVVLATKGGRFDSDIESGFDFSYQGVVDMCEGSLRRLRTDHVDVYQLHDIDFGDKEQVFNEAIAALFDLREQGKVRFIGVTGFPLALLSETIREFDLDTVLSFCHYNILNRTLDEGLVPAAKETDTAIINGSILHMGILTESGPPDWHMAPERVKLAGERVRTFCREQGTSISDLSIQFAFANPEIAVTLLGASRIESFQRTLDALAQPLDRQLLEAVDQIIGDDMNLTWPMGRPENWEPGAIVGTTDTGAG
jgi:L-galactose dehydrogenase